MYNLIIPESCPKTYDTYLEKSIWVIILEEDT